MRICLLVLSLLFVPAVLVAQSTETPTRLKEKEVRKYLLDHPKPAYPPIARAAHIQGDVQIAVLIDTSGAVSEEKFLNGPPMLQQAALEAVKHWTFTPFATDGAAHEVVTVLTIPFRL
ncbi:MAG TPA: energy transducer TonB [Acidobacteriaceae bacterium]|jgi:protein TonB|nr:energy transducer TonB [Acidobacteriaceae bacterium]